MAVTRTLKYKVEQLCKSHKSYIYDEGYIHKRINWLWSEWQAEVKDDKINCFNEEILEFLQNNLDNDEINYFLKILIIF